MTTTHWDLSWSGPPLPLSELALHLVLLQCLCCRATQLAGEEDADPDNPDEAELLTTLAWFKRAELRALLVKVAGSGAPAAAPLLINPAAVASGGPVRLVYHGATAILLDAVRRLGGTHGAQSIHFDTAGIAAALARLRD